MTATRIFRFSQTAAQSGSTSNVAGIHSRLHRPDGWGFGWESPYGGFPAFKDLSAVGAPLVLQNVFGQVNGQPTQCLIQERPGNYNGGLFSMIAKYEGDVVLHFGSVHNSPDANIEHLISLFGGWETATDRAENGLKTWIAMDAFWECPTNLIARNIHFAESLRAMGFEIAIEGGTPVAMAGILPVSLHLWQHTALTNMVNNPEARKGIAPIDHSVEQVVWIDDPKDGTVESSVEAATLVNKVGVIANPVSEPSTPMDAFQKSAAQPMSAAISPGMTKEEVVYVWGK